MPCNFENAFACHTLLSKNILNEKVKLHYKNLHIIEYFLVVNDFFSYNC